MCGVTETEVDAKVTAGQIAPAAVDRSEQAALADLCDKPGTDSVTIAPVPFQSDDQIAAPAR